MRTYTVLIAAAVMSALMATPMHATEVIAVSQVGSVAPSSRYNTADFLVQNYNDGEMNIGLLQFDLSSLSSDPIATATLDLFHLWNADDDAVFNIYINTSAWAPYTRKWSKRPTHVATPTAVLTIDDLATGVWRSVDVTDAVNLWTSGEMANYGFTIERVDQSNPYVFFSAKNTLGAAPTLTITQAAAVPEPAMWSMLLVGFALTGVALRARPRMSAHRAR
jgi:hypothetical protein